ncbi:serine/threonine protein kinase [Lacisediminihabitans profunda]|uniref:non-specific serine/threonine protein kinase n=2 Tax=Lacisediminihabitans profunda TaxID=2594790 RepID=A0A5C8UUH5_9MICO|nr:serine/threonine protein kinase [Lacisediminihabitans profunda]
MASVYRARDESLGRTVALKLFDSNATDAEALRRETSEIRLLASLNHHALVTLFDANVEDDRSDQRAYLAMELVDGPTLQARIERGPVAESDVAAMAADLAEALHVVHARGVVHRDIKPANILLAPSPVSNREFRAKLADFGIAHLIDSTRLTTPGTVVGTAAYVSPEQAKGEAPGAPTDIYALGLVLLETLTGTREFPGSMVESLGARLARDPVVPASLGTDWVQLLTAMTAQSPAERPSALEVAESAHAIERSAGSQLDRSDTVAFATPDDGQDNAPTALMTDAPTAVLGGHTAPAAAVRPSGDTGQRTEVFGHEEMPRPRRRLPRRVLAVGLTVLALAAVVVVLVLFAHGNPAPAPTASLPSVGGQLDAHLRQLLASVTK